MPAVVTMVIVVRIVLVVQRSDVMTLVLGLIMVVVLVMDPMEIVLVVMASMTLLVLGVILADDHQPYLYIRELFYVPLYVMTLFHAEAVLH